jgi:hypothetical protein
VLADSFFEGHTRFQRGSSGGGLTDGTKFYGLKWWHNSHVNATEMNWSWDQTNTAIRLGPGGSWPITRFYIDYPVNVSDSTDSSSVSTGALTTAGGLGVTKKITAGGVISTTDATASSTISTGSIVAAGGAGIAGTVNANHFAQVGANTYWEDYQLLGSARVGGTAPDFVELPAITQTGLYGWRFSGTVDNELHSVFQLPHSSSGAPLKPHIHLTGNWTTAPASADMRWSLTWHAWKASSTSFAGTGNTSTKTFTMPAFSSAMNGSVQFAFDDIDLGSIDTGLRPSACIMFRLKRLANSDAADTLTDPVYILGWDVHYPVIQMGGSESSYP